MSTKWSGDGEPSQGCIMSADSPLRSPHDEAETDGSTPQRSMSSVSNSSNDSNNQTFHLAPQDAKLYVAVINLLAMAEANSPLQELRRHCLDRFLPPNLIQVAVTSNVPRKLVYLETEEIPLSWSDPITIENEERVPATPSPSLPPASSSPSVANNPLAQSTDSQHCSDTIVPSSPLPTEIAPFSFPSLPSSSSPPSITLSSSSYSDSSSSSSSSSSLSSSLSSSSSSASFISSSRRSPSINVVYRESLAPRPKKKLRTTQWSDFKARFIQAVKSPSIEFVSKYGNLEKLYDAVSSWDTSQMDVDGTTDCKEEETGLLDRALTTVRIMELYSGDHYIQLMLKYVEGKTLQELWEQLKHYPQFNHSRDKFYSKVAELLGFKSLRVKLLMKFYFSIFSLTGSYSQLRHCLFRMEFSYTKWIEGFLCNEEGRRNAQQIINEVVDCIYHEGNEFKREELNSELVREIIKNKTIEKEQHQKAIKQKNKGKRFINHVQAEPPDFIEETEEDGALEEDRLAGTESGDDDDLDPNEQQHEQEEDRLADTEPDDDDPEQPHEQPRVNQNSGKDELPLGRD